MSAAVVHLLVILAGYAVAQNRAPPPVSPGQQPVNLPSTVSKTCTVESSKITCTCRPGLQELQFTKSFMIDSVRSTEIEVNGCSSVLFEVNAFKELDLLESLSVLNTINVTFHKDVCSDLQHLRLFNIKSLTTVEDSFSSISLTTMFFDNVYADTVPSGAFVELNKLLNVTFKDVHFAAVQNKAFGFRMLKDSEFKIINSEILGMQKGAIKVEPVTKFTIQDTKLTGPTTENALDVYAEGSLIISDCDLQSLQLLMLNVSSSSNLQLVKNVVRSIDIKQMQQQLPKAVKAKVEGNTFPCKCDHISISVLGLLNNYRESRNWTNLNYCDEHLCGSSVRLSTLDKCNGTAVPKEACDAAVQTRNTTAQAPTESSVAVQTVTQQSRNSAAGAPPVAVVLLLAAHAAVALAL